MPDDGDQEPQVSAGPRSSDAGENEAFVAEQFQKYLVNTDDSGVTLMWHGLSTKCSVYPHLIRIIEDIDAQGVAYLYLPLNYWEKSSKGKDPRNKGYAFVHFKTAADAEEFARKVSEHTTRPEGSTHIQQHTLTATTPATQHGVSLNLTQLVSAPQRRAAAPAVYLPNAEGKFECVTIASLRKHFLARFGGAEGCDGQKGTVPKAEGHRGSRVKSTKSAFPGPGQKHWT